MLINVLLKSIPQRPLTLEEFLDLADCPDGGKRELVRGTIVEMPPASGRHSGLQGTLVVLLDTYAKQRQRQM